MSQSMKGFYLSACDAQAGLRYLWRRSRKAGAAIELINLIYPATAGARYEQIVRLKLLPRAA
jgi:hypothetical protein